MRALEDPQTQPGDYTCFLSSSRLCLEKLNLDQETCIQKSIWQYPEIQEQDQENSSGQTPKLTNPTQHSDTPQEEALRLDLWEISKNPNYSKASVRKAQERTVDGSSGVLTLPA